MPEKELADEIAKRRGRRYPAHEFIAAKFPDYMEALLHLDEIIRAKERRFNEPMHELFHILALAVEGSNPHNQPHLKQHLKKGQTRPTPRGNRRGAYGLRKPCGL